MNTDSPTEPVNTIITEYQGRHQQKEASIAHSTNVNLIFFIRVHLRDKQKLSDSLIQMILQGQI